MTKPHTTGSGAGLRESVTTAARPAQDNHRTDIPAELRRRRVAGWRCEPLSDAELVSWRLAWLHLAELDLPAVVPSRVLVAAGWSR